MDTEKPIAWLGSSLNDLLQFPANIKRELGYDLSLIQAGREPRDYKPMPSLGSGILEIRVKDSHGAFRLVYVARMKNHIYVLHTFQKKTQKTAPKDTALIRQRYRMMQETENEA